MTNLQDQKPISDDARYSAHYYIQYMTGSEILNGCWIWSINVLERHRTAIGQLIVVLVLAPSLLGRTLTLYDLQVT